MCFQYLNGGINVGDRFATQIEIGGCLASSKIADLIDAINSESLSLKWEDAPVNIKSLNDFYTCINDKTKTIFLNDLERSQGDISSLEGACIDLQLTWKTIVEPKYEYNGELRFFSPETGLIELECDADGHQIAPQEELKEILQLICHSTLLSLSVQIQEKINQAIGKLEKLTQEFVVPAFEIMEK